MVQLAVCRASRALGWLRFAAKNAKEIFELSANITVVLLLVEHMMNLHLSSPLGKTGGIMAMFAQTGKGTSGTLQHMKSCSFDPTFAGKFSAPNFGY